MTIPSRRLVYNHWIKSKGLILHFCQDCHDMESCPRELGGKRSSCLRHWEIEPEDDLQVICVICEKVINYDI